MIGWTKYAKRTFCCPYVGNIKKMTFGSVSKDINTVSHTHWTHCPMKIKYSEPDLNRVKPKIFSPTLSVDKTNK